VAGEDRRGVVNGGKMRTKDKEEEIDSSGFIPTW
jgi:hypothetical protein